MGGIMWQFLLGFIVAWSLCHAYTHIQVAAECERLGGFFVGKKVYKCVLVEDLKEQGMKHEPETKEN